MAFFRAFHAFRGTQKQSVVIPDHPNIYLSGLGGRRAENNSCATSLLRLLGCVSRPRGGEVQLQVEIQGLLGSTL